MCFQDMVGLAAECCRDQQCSRFMQKMLIEIDNAAADRIEFAGTVCLAIATADKVASRRSRVVGGRDWVRLGAVEMGLDCLRRFLQGLPVDERIDFEK